MGFATDNYGFLVHRSYEMLTFVRKPEDSPLGLEGNQTHMRNTFRETKAGKRADHAAGGKAEETVSVINEIPSGGFPSGGFY